MKGALILTAIIGLIWDAYSAIGATVLTATWDVRPPAEQVREYRLYETINGVWFWRASPVAPPFRFAATKGSHGFAMTAVNATGESARSETFTVKVKH